MPRKKQIVGTKRKASPYETRTAPDQLIAVQPMTLPPVLRLPSGQEIPAVVGFGTVGPLTGDQFDALWNQLSPRGKAKVRDYADRLGLTNRGVLNRFPQFRTG